MRHACKAIFIRIVLPYPIVSTAPHPLIPQIFVNLTNPRSVPAARFRGLPPVQFAQTLPAAKNAFLHIGFWGRCRTVYLVCNPLDIHNPYGLLVKYADFLEHYTDLYALYAMYWSFCTEFKKGFDKSAKMQYHEVTDRKQIENKTVTT